ncbi:MAG: flagellar hook-associated protein FlgK [Nitrospirae bacterium]|nr:flagellar hook-associated protein FlgK [Nitrospirota bacterium]MCL5977502.1 flagellar hook-associated protein FlgK [Nitrospirota bacterium]
MSILGLFDIGKTALITTRRALDATAHNVANVSTPGYSRQDVILQNLSGATTGTTATTSGRGVGISEIKRMYDSFTSLQLRTENSNLSYWEAYGDGTVKLENIFNEASDTGVGTAINDFFNAWQELAQNPEGYAQRTALIKNAEYLASRINRAYTSLNDERTEIFRSSQTLANEVNVITSRIADLNEKIVSAPDALDLKDQRDSLVERLNQILKVTTFEDNIGRYTVLATGTPLVDAGRVYKMSAEIDSSNTMHFKVDLGQSSLTDITNFVSGGELKANLDLRDTKIAGFINKLNAFALDMSLTINSYHETGYGLDGSTGNQFFKEVSNVFFSADSKPSSGGSVSTMEIRDLNLVNFEKRYKIDYVAATASPGSDYQAEEAGATDIYWRVQESTDGTTWSTVDTSKVILVVNTASSPDYRTLEFGGIRVQINGDQGNLTSTEQFDIKFNNNAALEMAVKITDPQKVAAASGDLDTQFTITAGQNDVIRINGATNVTLAAGTYTRFGLATELQRVTNLAGFNVTATFDAQNNKFKIINNDAANITLNWTDTTTTLEDIFGFNADSIIPQNGFDTSDLEVKAGTVIIDSSNNAIRFSEDNGATYVTATIPLGTYTRREMAEVLKKALEDAGTGTSYNYSASYSTTTKQYTITNSGTSTNPSAIILDWTHSSTTAEGIFGFSSNSVISSGSNDISDSSVYPILPGDNTNARIIADLANKTFISAKTPSDFYRGMASDVGIEASLAKTSVKFYDALVDELERKRQEFSGVSLDEEAANLIKYQKSFEAAAKMINVADELLETLIGMVGR